MASSIPSFYQGIQSPYQNGLLSDNEERDLSLFVNENAQVGVVTHVTPGSKFESSEMSTLSSGSDEAPCFEGEHFDYPWFPCAAKDKQVQFFVSRNSINLVNWVL